MIRAELKRPRGTQDILPPESRRVAKLRRVAFDVAERYGFEPIETPIFEQTPVFTRVGETTDIVQHERYRFVDAGGVDLTLRPEGTAAVARAFVENGLAQAPQPVRLAYWGPMFRRERPQAGRYRQHTQFGAELYGSGDPSADAEVILLATAVVEAAGLSRPEVRINSIGCDVCRPGYREALVEYYRSREGELCADCQARLEKNPLRLLDCKIDVAIRQAAPDLADYWCADCRDHIGGVIDRVARAGRAIGRDAHLVRGLDYYTRTVFEVGHPSLGPAVALFGGGRYDGLTASLDGPAVPAVGFGIGIERILSATAGRFDADPVERVAVLHVPGFATEAFLLAEEIRRAGWPAESDVLGRSLRAQLKDAARRARYGLIVGGREWEAGQVVVRDLSSGVQEAVARDDVGAYLAERRQRPVEPV